MKFSIAWIAIGFALAASCFSDESLYQRLGGREGLQPVVNDFVDVFLKDSRVRMNSSAKAYMDRCNSSELKRRLFEILCEFSGGPCKSEASRISLRRSIHTMELMPSDWDAIMADVSAELSKFKIGESEKSEVRALVDRSGKLAIAGTN